MLRKSLLILFGLTVVLSIIRPHASTAYQAPALSGKITYATLTDKGYEIAVYDFETGTSEIITNTESGDLYFPHWSADGKTIMYTYDSRELMQGGADDTSYTRTLRLIKPDGTDDRLLSEIIDNPTSHPTAWSGDGQYLLVGNIIQTKNAPGGLLYTFDVTSDEYVIHELPFDEADAVFEAVWTPDNRLLVIMQDGVYVLDADGNNLERILEQELVRTGFALSPDGKTLAIQANLRDKIALELVDLASGEHRFLLDFPVIAWAGQMAWSPDGEALAMYIQDPATGDMVTYVVDLADETPEWVLVGKTDIIADWSPDSRALVFSDYANLYIYSLDTKESSLLFEGHGVQPDWHE